MKGRMTCREGVSLLMEYCEGVVSAPQRRVMEAHVGGCVRCRGFVRSYRETPRIMREATASSLPARLGGRLRRMVAGLAGGRRSRRP